MAKRYTFNLVSKLYLKSLYRQQLCTGADSVSLTVFSAITFKLKMVWGEGKNRASGAFQLNSLQDQTCRSCLYKSMYTTLAGASCNSMEYPECALRGWF